MNLLKKLGKPINKIRSLDGTLEKLGKFGKLSGLGVLGAYSVARGLNDSGAEGSVFEFATGNANIDEEVLGLDLKPTDFVLPFSFPYSRVGMAMNHVPGLNPASAGAVVGGTLTGSAIGALAGKHFGRSLIGAGIGGILGGVGSGYAATSKIGMDLQKLAALRETGTLNSTMLGYHFTQASKPFNPNTMPTADGNLVFGLYNSRFGG